MAYLCVLVQVQLVRVCVCVGRRKDRVGSFINLHKSVVEGRDKLHTVSFIVQLLWSNNLRRWSLPIESIKRCCLNYWSLE